MKKILTLIICALCIALPNLAHADVIGNKASKLFFPANCSYAKLIKADNQVVFKSSADAVAAGYKASSKCQDSAPATMAFVGNKSSKLFFPADCSVVKMIKDDNKVSFNSSADAIAAGYKASTKCTDTK